LARDYQMTEMEMTLLETDSDDEIEILSIFAMEEERLKRERASTSRHGSILGHQVIKRDYLQSQERLFRDYFAPDSVFPPRLFRRRFRMNRPLFFHLQSATTRKKVNCNEIFCCNNFHFVVIDFYRNES
jgi:hypothetical protein